MLRVFSGWIKWEHFNETSPANSNWYAAGRICDHRSVVDQLSVFLTANAAGHHSYSVLSATMLSDSSVVHLTVGKVIRQ